MGHFRIISTPLIQDHSNKKHARHELEKQTAQNFSKISTGDNHILEQEFFERLARARSVLQNMEDLQLNEKRIVDMILLSRSTSINTQTPVDIKRALDLV